MPKCCKCGKPQAKLNKGGFCKACFKIKYNPEIIESVIKMTNSTDNIDESIDLDHDEAINDRCMINVIKQSMLSERKWNDEMQAILKQQVEFLQNEIINKNTLIERLMVELYNNDDARQSVIVADNRHTSELINSSLTEIRNEDNLPLGNYTIRTQTIDDNFRNPTLYPHCSIVTHANRYDALYNGSDKTSDDEIEIEKDAIIELQSSQRNDAFNKRPNVIVNKYPENDQYIYRQPRVVPGNSSYASRVENGRKILLLSDSILGRIQMKKLNYDIKAGHAFRKYYPGATPTEMAYNCVPILKSAQPDVVVIHSGTNSIFKDNINDAGDTIFNIVKVCREHGVGEIFISGITYRNRNMDKVRRLNNFIESQQQIHDFVYINNDNINVDDVGNDKLHLNYAGIVKIANNITNALNTLHLD